MVSYMLFRERCKLFIYDAVYENGNEMITLLIMRIGKHSTCSIDSIK